MKRYKPGYMTLEATIIILFAVCILGSVIQLGLLCYTKVFYEQNVYLSALRGSRQLLMNDSQVKSFVKEELDEMSGNHFITIPSEAEISVRIGRIKVEQEVGPFDVKAEAKRFYPARTIRTYARAKVYSDEGDTE